MRIYLKTFLCFSFSLINSSKAYSYFKVELINQTNYDMLYNHSFDINTVAPAFTIYVLEPKKKTDIQKNEIISFNNQKITFTDTEIPCSWIKFFGNDYPHGWGLNLKVNDKDVGTICANKKMLVDPTIQARLEYFKNETETAESFLKFSNIGWWQSNEKFPRSIIVKLEDIVK